MYIVLRNINNNIIQMDCETTVHNCGWFKHTNDGLSLLGASFQGE